jgi:outer membrane protein TolC
MSFNILNQFTKHFIALLALVPLLSMHQLAAAQTSDSLVQKLSLKEALKRANEMNHQVMIARHKQSQASGQSLESWSGFLPKVTLSETFIRSDDPIAVFGGKLRQGIFNLGDFSGPDGTPLTMFMDPNLPKLNNPSEFNNFTTAIEVQQPILNFDAILGRSAAAAASEGYDYNLKRTQEAIAIQVEKSYFGLILATNKVNAIEKSLKSIQAYVKEAGAAFNKGLITKADLLSVEVRQAELQEQLLVASNDAKTAGDMLRFILRINNDVTIVPTDSIKLSQTLPTIDLSQSPVQRSDLKAMDAFERASSRKYKSKWMGWLPRVNAFGKYEWNGDAILDNDGENWTIGVSAQWNILDGFSRLGQAKTESARAEEMKMKYEEAKEKSAVELKQAYRNLLSAQKRVAIAEKSVMQASESFKIINQRFREGLERTSEFLNSEAALTNARLRLMKAKYDFKIAGSELEFFNGTYTIIETN